jgi:DNA-binding response OmpR family regulator
MTEQSERYRILIVDDDPVNLKLVAGLLSQALPCDLCFALGGAEALALMDRVAPDLVVLDVNMPGMSGFETCAAIRSLDRQGETPIIFVTAHNDQDSILRGFEAGGSDYVVRPFSGQELLARIKVHLELKLRRDQLVRQKEVLEEALLRIKRLEGIIPICMYCHKIRDDHSSWQQLEQYISEHSEVHFSHGICPDCYERAVRSLEAA